MFQRGRAQLPVYANSSAYAGPLDSDITLGTWLVQDSCTPRTHKTFTKEGRGEERHAALVHVAGW